MKIKKVDELNIVNENSLDYDYGIHLSKIANILRDNGYYVSLKLEENEIIIQIDHGNYITLKW